MTRSQFAWAVLADEKWVENAARLLGINLEYTPAEALWLGLVRVFTQQVGVSLARASDLADEALHLDPHLTSVVIGRSENGTAGVSVELARFHSSYAAALSAATELGGARRRGRSASKRKPLSRAEQYGVDIGLLREGLKLSVGDRLSRLDENAAFIGAIHHPARKRRT